MAIRADDVDLGRDRLLVDRFQAGDAEAFAELYSCYFARLRRYCARRVHNLDVAEEIAQETFVRALGAFPAFRGERRVYPWLTVIAGNLCADHHRRLRITEPVADVDLGTVDGADEPILYRESLDLLDAALDRVKPRHREVLLLREAEGLSYADIGARLGAPRSTIETLLHRARLALRREAQAVAGRDRLVTVPIVGALLSAFSRWRQRLTLALADRPHLAEAGTVAAAPLAGAVAALSLALGVGAAPSEPAVRVVAESEPGVGSPAPSTVVAPEAVAPVIAVPAPPEGTSAPVAPSAKVEVVRVYVGEDGARRAAEEAEQQPLSERVGPAFLGADPALVARDVDQVLSSVTGG